MAEPDVTAEDVQRFLKEVAKRQVCPSCGTEDEPACLVESHSIITKPVDVHYDTKKKTYEFSVGANGVPYNTGQISHLIGKFFVNFSDRDFIENGVPMYSLTLVFVVCPRCGRVEQFALDRIIDWLGRPDHG